MAFIRYHLCFVAMLGFVGCVTEVETESSSSVDKNSEALFGDLSTSGCNSAQAALVGSAHRLGKAIAPGPEFGACIQHRMFYFYKPCLDPSDPFLGQSIAYQTQKAPTIMRSTNLADVEVTCATVSGGEDGHAGIGDYGDGVEELTINSAMLNNTLAQGVSDYERANVAGLIWHEAMHQQSYEHSEDEDDFCGYPEGTYGRGFNSVPYISDRCMRSAGIHSRLFALNAANWGQSFPLGRHRASAGDFSIVGDNQISAIQLPPGSQARYCTDEGTGTGAGACTTSENLTLEYGGRVTIASGTSFIEVQPRLLAFAQTNFDGTEQAFSFGEFRSDLGGLSQIGNDTIRSLYVPPGMRVRACEHEGAPVGHGSGRCVFYDAPVADLGTMSNNISYLDVEPVVTAFREANGFGVRQNYGRGAYIASNGGLGAVGDNQMVSIFFPLELFAQVCSDYTLTGQGAGTCKLLSKSNLNIDPTATSNISYLLVGPNYGDTLTLSVNKTGSGSVVSTPFGIRCGLSGACSAQFYRRSQVRLSATPTSSNAITEWTGCDSVSGTTCSVTLMNARTVSVKFKQPVFDQGCYNACLPLCRADGFTAAQCVQMCRADCTS